MSEKPTKQERAKAIEKTKSKERATGVEKTTTRERPLLHKEKGIRDPHKGKGEYDE